MNAAPLTAAQIEAMKKNTEKWNKKLANLRGNFNPTPEEKKAAHDSLMADHFANLPHYVLD